MRLGSRIPAAANLSKLKVDADKAWKGYTISDVVLSLVDDQKAKFGSDNDFSIRYDSTDDCFYVRDEINGVETKIPKNVAMDISAHKGRHASGGADEIAAGDLVAGADPRSSSHETRHESGGADALPLANLPQPGDDTKIQFGAGPDYSVRYDSADDCYYVRDEVNAVDVMKLPKNPAGAPIDLSAHEARHESGGNDALPLANLPQPGDDTKITLGAGPDFSLRYDSADDVYYVRDEVNAVDILKLVKNAAGAPIDLASHGARHADGGDDELDASDLAGAAGAAGQFLKTDGAACSWADVPKGARHITMEWAEAARVGKTESFAQVDKGVIAIRAK